MSQNNNDIRYEDLIYGYHAGNKIYMSKVSCAKPGNEFIMELSGGNIPTIRGGQNLGLLGVSIDMDKSTFIAVVGAIGGKMCDQPVYYRATTMVTGKFVKCGIGVHKESK